MLNLATENTELTEKTIKISVPSAFSVVAQTKRAATIRERK